MEGTMKTNPTPTNLQRDCGMCGQPLAPDHVCGNYTAPTNPPTESRECNCIDCRVGRDLGLKPNYPTEPAVEKWERAFYDDLSDNDWIADDPDGPDMVIMPFYELKERVHSLLSHSLQEAKAEEVERVKLIIKLLKNDAITTPDEKEDSFKAGYLASLEALDDLLSTLTTKESIKQEEQK